MQPGGATADRNRVLCADTFGECGLEAVDRRALRQVIAAQNGNDRVDVRLVNALPSVADHRRYSIYAIAASNCLDSSHSELSSLVYSNEGSTRLPTCPP